MPSPPSLGGAGLAEVAQAVRFPGRRVHLALRRYSERPSIDRWALDCRQSSFRRVTRVSPRHSFSVFSPCSALSACSPIAPSARRRRSASAFSAGRRSFHPVRCAPPRRSGARCSSWRACTAAPTATTWRSGRSRTSPRRRAGHRSRAWRSRAARRPRSRPRRAARPRRPWPRP